MTFSSRRASAREGSLDQYLKEISQYPLIDRAEEARLAKLIRKGEEEALNKLVRSNLRFVVSVAKKYQNQGVPLPDLINEGNLGLIRAAHKFDETKGIKFISYAVWWIRQAILQALAEQSRIVRVPLNRAGALYRIGRRSSTLLQELGREPTVEEVGRQMDLSASRVREIMEMAQYPVSLQTPVGKEEDASLEDFVEDSSAVSPLESALSDDLREHAAGLLKTLTPREEQVVRMRFGIDDDSARTLDEVGRSFNVTRERIRQIEAVAMRKLRHPSRAAKLEAFLDS
jgi:RNA polymerase primary sigma factor